MAQQRAGQDERLNTDPPLPLNQTVGGSVPGSCNTGAHFLMPSIGQRVFTAAVVLTLARIVGRLLSVVAMLTVARWLGPGEMGVFAVAIVIVAAVEQLSETGFRLALIQRQGDIGELIAPVRTIMSLRGVALSAVVYVSAQYMANFFNCPDSLAIIETMALLPLIRGLEPLTLTLAQKELRFKSTLVITMLSSTLGLMTGIGVAWVNPSAWAMVWMTLVTAAIQTIGSTIIARPAYLIFSLRWKGVTNLGTFGFWIFVNGFASYVFIKGVDWIIGRCVDVEMLAIYQMAFLLCTAVTVELGGVISQVTFPAYSAMQTDLVRLRAAFVKALAVFSVLVIGLASIVCASSQHLIPLVLGKRWIETVDFVPWVMVYAVCLAYASVLSSIFSAINKLQIWTFTVLSMLLLQAAFVLPSFSWNGVMGIVISMALIGIASQSVRIVIISKILGIERSELYLSMGVPLVAGIASLLLTVSLMPLPISGAAMSAVSSIAVAAVAYAGMLALFTLCFKKYKHALCAKTGRE